MGITALRLGLVIGAFASGCANAQDAALPDVICSGGAAQPHDATAATEATSQSPAWRLELRAGQAALSFAGLTEMQVRHEARAMGGDWPRAMTLIGERDTGILLLHRRACDGMDYEAQLLTQRGQTPLLLTGCCEALK